MAAEIKHRISCLLNGVDDDDYDQQYDWSDPHEGATKNAKMTESNDDRRTKTKKYKDVKRRSYVQSQHHSRNVRGESAT